MGYLTKSGIFTTGLLLVSTWSFQAVAQQGESAGRIEEVIVTARKRAEDLQTVPIAVSAFSADVLSKKGIDSTSDLAFHTPSLQYSSGSQGGSSAQFFIRGIGQLDFISTVDPGVGVYVDGVYVARSAGSLLDLANVERVEVLRGPQGTLFGKNTIGGAVNIVTSTPDEEYHGKLSITKGSRDRTNIKGSINVPLSETVFFSAALSSKQQDGFGRNSILNQDPASAANQRVLDVIDTGNENKSVVLGKLRWAASDDFELTLSVDNSRTRERGDATFLQAVNLAAGTLPDGSNTFVQGNLAAARIPFELYSDAFITGDSFTSFSGHVPGNETDVTGYSVTAVWDLNEAVTFKSITALRELEVATGLDFDQSPIEFFDQTVNLDQSQFSQEFQLFGSALDDRLEWLAGIYHITEDIDSFIRLNLAHPEDPDNFDVFEHNQIDTESNAAFFQGTWSINDNLSITAGLRYTREEKTLDFSHELARAPGFFLFEPGFGTVSETFSNSTPKLSTEYITDAGTLWYVSATKGFKSGAFNGRPFSQEDVENIANPEEVLSYEVGTKIDFLDNRGRLNVALFHSDYEDLQATICRNSGVCVVQNAAGATIKGAEIALDLAPTDKLRLDIAVSFLDARYDTLDADVAANLPQDGDLIQTPDYTFTLGVEYNVPLANQGGLGFRVDYFKTDSFYHNPPNGEFDFEPGYAIANARITYTPPGGRWRVAAYGLNMSDEEYAEYREDLTGFGTSEAFAAAPSEYGLEFSFEF